MVQHLSQAGFAELEIPGNYVVCPLCNKIFMSKTALETHKRIHTGERPFRCLDCGKSFTQKTHLKTHSRLHTGIKPYHCQICNMSFSDSSNFRKHKFIRHIYGMTAYECSHCHKVFGTKFNIDRHLRVHTGEKPFKCSCFGCPLVGKLKDAVMFRLSAGRQVEGRTMCFVCGKLFPTNARLERHMLIHTGEKSFKCSYCGKGFKQKAHLTGHERIHTGEKPFTCRMRWLSADSRKVVGCGGPLTCCVCGKLFSTKTDVERHMRIHTGEKPFKCSFCGKGFKQKGHLTRCIGCLGVGEVAVMVVDQCVTFVLVYFQTTSIISATKLGSVQGVFKCSWCNKTFQARLLLEAHQRIHTGERPFKCSFCGKTFTQKGNLKKHVRVHTGEKPFQCPVCGKGFSDSSHRKTHMISHLSR
ncbi:zinc finger protein 665-like [Lineus longissimus]|uniref:zinc finger protein 665-like n=1 Tax=Lineus longissimus TaxID=88925 RepID=UPI00315DB3F1